MIYVQIQIYLAYEEATVTDVQALCSELEVEITNAAGAGTLTPAGACLESFELTVKALEGPP